MVTLKGNVTFTHDWLRHVMYKLVKQHSVVCVNLSVSVATLCLKVSIAFMHWVLKHLNCMHELIANNSNGIACAIVIDKHTFYTLFSTAVAINWTIVIFCCVD